MSFVICTTDPAETDPLLKIWRLIKRKTIDPSQALFSLDISGLQDSQTKRILNAINIRREYIPEGHFIFLLWSSIQQIDDIPKYAKDFWSFRTSAHKFEAKPFRRKGRIKGLKDLRKQIQETKEFIKKVEKQKKPKMSLLASLYFNLGEQAYKASDLELSLKSWEKAKKLYQQIGDKRNLSGTLGNIGNVYKSKGDLDEALKYYKEALEIDREIGYLQGIITDLRNIGNVYKDMGEKEKAEEVLRELKVLKSKK